LLLFFRSSAPPLRLLCTAPLQQEGSLGLATQTLPTLTCPFYSDIRMLENDPTPDPEIYAKLQNLTKQEKR
jgi:hypothetical protein